MIIRRMEMHTLTTVRMDQALTVSKTPKGFLPPPPSPTTRDFRREIVIASTPARDGLVVATVLTMFLHPLHNLGNLGRGRNRESPPLNQRKSGVKQGKGRACKAFCRREFDISDDHFPTKGLNFRRLPPRHSRAMVKEGVIL